MDKKYRIINTGKGILNIDPTKLQEVTQNLDSLITAFPYTPYIDDSFNCTSPEGLPSTYTKLGSIVTARVVLSYQGHTSANQTALVTFNIPEVRLSTNIFNIGIGTAYTTNGDTSSLVVQTVSGSGTLAIVSFKPPTTAGGTLTLILQYPTN